MKYFLKVQKSEDGNPWVIRGVASGTDLDSSNEQMSLEVLYKFVDFIKETGMPLTHAHPKYGPIDGDLGVLYDAEVVARDGGYDLVVYAELDKDNNLNELMLKKIDEGKKFAMSIEGLAPKYTYEGGVKVYTDMIPKSISITTEPSYYPSYIEVVQKSATQIEDNLHITKLQMEEEKVQNEVSTETEQATQEAAAEATVDTAEAAPETDNAADATTSEAEAAAEGGEEAGEDTPAAEDLSEVVKSLKDEVQVLKSRLEDTDTPKAVSSLLEVVKSLVEKQEKTDQLIAQVPMVKRTLVKKSSEAEAEKPKKSLKESLAEIEFIS